MSGKHNRYSVIIVQELSRVDLNVSEDLFIIPNTRLEELTDGLTTRILQEAAQYMLDDAAGNKA